MRSPNTGIARCAFVGSTECYGGLSASLEVSILLYENGMQTRWKSRRMIRCLVVMTDDVGL